MIYSFSSKTVPSLSQVGGKAKALMETTKAGFQVPEGFVLSVDFFKPWIESIKQTPQWEVFISSPSKNNCDALKEKASSLTMSLEQKGALEEALKDFESNTIFAVRSSSPEEDLEDTSFAGQYETILGVHVKDINKAINTAFQSMLDTRVVEYKKLNNLPIDNPRIAIVVQRMVASDRSGIAFSLNPNNNAYDEAVINASFGLGETIVSGQVTPDTYIVEKVKKEVLQKNISTKEIGLWLQPNGGTLEQPNKEADKQALDQNEIMDVMELVTACEKHYGKPMDIEWAYEKGKLYLLQSRPITTYIKFYDELITKPGEKKMLYLDLTVLTQGFQDNFSVLGQEVWTEMLKKAKQGTMPVGKDGVVYNVHGRQYMNISNWAKGMGVGVVTKSMGMYDTPVREVFKTIDLKNDYLPEVKTPTSKKLTKDALGMSLRMIGPMISTIVNPEKGRKAYIEASKDTLRKVKEELNYDQPFADVVEEGMSCFATLADHALGIGAAMISKALIGRMFKNQGVDDLIIALNMDLPHNPTSEMGYHMLRLASYEEIIQTKTEEEFREKIANRTYSEEFMKDLDEYIYYYGSRGFKEIDMASERLYNDPGLLFIQLKSLNLEHNSMSNIKERKQEAYNKLLSVATQMGKSKKFIKHAKIHNDLMGFREDPKYVYVVLNGELRKHAMKLGHEFANQGRLDKPEHIFDLTIAQVTAAEKDSGLKLRELREANLAPRRALEHITDWPKFIDSRGKIFRYIRESEDGDLVGDPISPGVIRGKAKVLASPYEKPLEEGEILVTRATEPSWTPIFVNAAGVVLEIGGPLQHGAIIAREYGIPCVSGLEGVTKIIKDGDLIEVDGSSGIVKIIQEAKD